MPSVPKRALMLPGASVRASPEFAGPSNLFHSHIASSLKISMAITGPLVINWISSLGNRGNLNYFSTPSIWTSALTVTSVISGPEFLGPVKRTWSALPLAGEKKGLLNSDDSTNLNCTVLT